MNKSRKIQLQISCLIRSKFRSSIDKITSLKSNRNSNCKYQKLISSRKLLRSKTQVKNTDNKGGQCRGTGNGNGGVKNGAKTSEGGNVGRNGSPFDFQASRNYPSRTFHIPELEQSDRYDPFSLFFSVPHSPTLSFVPPPASPRGRGSPRKRMKRFTEKTLGEGCNQPEGTRT